VPSSNPQAVAEMRRRGERRVPYDVLGVNPSSLTSRTRGNRLRIALVAPQVDKDRRASAWRFTGLRRGSGRWSCEQGAQR